MSNYASQKLKNALVQLITLEGDSKVRLEHVFIHELAALGPRDFPPHLQAEFAAIKAKLTALPPTRDGEGRLRVTLESLAKKEIEQVAQRLVTLALETHART